MKTKARIGACLAVLVAAAALNTGSPLVPVARAAEAQKLIGTVYFLKNSDEITSIAAGQLDDIAKAYAANKDQQVTISGHADPVECVPEECDAPSDGYAVGLSQRRAANVRAYLSEKGVPDGVMITQAFGGSRMDGKPVNQRRRAEISFGAGSGW
jgi:outer membrane protein OmpA-like peptidoglycan-associated protein